MHVLAIVIKCLAAIIELFDCCARCNARGRTNVCNTDGAFENCHYSLSTQALVSLLCLMG